jgi:predicted aldo/keto reductase-like oxidoreductase
MIYTEYGNTGKVVSRLGFGTNRFNEQYLQDDKGLEYCADVVRYAASCGINYFDTSHNYDQSKSEIIFGLAFKDIKTPFFVSTKSRTDYDKTSDDVLKRVESSLEAMMIPKISFYNMWGIMNKEHYKLIMASGGPYEGLLRAKELGYIEHIVCSVHANIEEILEIIEDGYFEGITISYNIMTAKKMQPVLDAAYKKNIALVSMNSLGGGVIPWLHEFFVDIMMPNDENVVVSALRFNASHKELTVSLSGMGCIDEVEKNIKALENENCINQDRIKKIFFNDNPVFQAFCTGCGYCKPCPVNVPIKEYLFAYNFNFFPTYGNKEDTYSETRNFPLVLEKLKEIFGIFYIYPIVQCKRCGLCEKRCTQKLPIVKRIYEIYEYFFICNDIENLRKNNIQLKKEIDTIKHSKTYRIIIILKKYLFPKNSIRRSILLFMYKLLRFIYRKFKYVFIK